MQLQKKYNLNNDIQLDLETSLTRLVDMYDNVNN